jgi:hypothetical protein
LVTLTKLDDTVLASDRTLAAEGVTDGTHIIATVLAPPPSATTGGAGEWDWRDALVVGEAPTIVP